MGGEDYRDLEGVRRGEEERGAGYMGAGRGEDKIRNQGASEDQGRDRGGPDRGRLGGVGGKGCGGGEGEDPGTEDA